MGEFPSLKHSERGAAPMEGKGTMPPVLGLTPLLNQFSFPDSGSPWNVEQLWYAALLIMSLDSITPIFFSCNYGTT